MLYELLDKNIFKSLYYISMELVFFFFKILIGDHPQTIPAKFGFNWANGEEWMFSIEENKNKEYKNIYLHKWKLVTTQPKYNSNI